MNTPAAASAVKSTATGSKAIPPYYALQTSVTIGYDPHNRPVTQTDARNGTTTTSYDALDRVTSVTQPSADGIASGLVTGYSYNVLGQRTKVTLPDSSETDYEYHPTGELKKVSGSQSYTVEYTYDPQGRKTTMTTTGQAGPAVTSWHYHAQRGWLSSKRYDNNEGPDYTYNVRCREVIIKLIIALQKG